MANNVDELFQRMNGMTQSLIQELRIANAERLVLRQALQEILELSQGGQAEKIASQALHDYVEIRREQHETNPATLFGRPVLIVECLRDVPAGNVP